MYGDYKMAAFEEANAEAEEKYGCDFYDLPSDKQDELYSRGLQTHFDKRIAAAELRDDTDQ